jgi:glycopeptide antibiotics resistance protein
VYGSLVPLQFQSIDLVDALDRFRNMPPLWFGLGTRADWVANILLFIPLTFLWMGALSCDRPPAARFAAALLIVPAAAAMAVALEFTQIWFPGRTVSRNDIVAEILGALVGAVAWLALGARVIRWLRQSAAGRDSRSRHVWLLELYLIGLITYSVIPLDLTISVTELYHKFQRGGVVVIPFSYGYRSASSVLYQFFADTAQFVPVGAWVALTQRKRLRARSPILAAAIGGGMIAALIEFAQLLVMSRFTDTTDVVLGTAGAGFGGWLAARYASTSGDPQFAPADPSAVSRRSLSWLAVIGGYSVFLLAGFLFPFEFTYDRALIGSRLESFFRVPFYALYLGTEFNAITQVLIRMLLFAPLGALWAAVAVRGASRGTRHIIHALALAHSVGLALTIEAIQIAMPSKVADLTEVIVCGTAAAMGLYVTVRLQSAEVGHEAP